MIARFVGLRFRIRVNSRARPFVQTRPSESVYRLTAFSNDRPTRLYSIRKWNCTGVARSFIHLPKPHHCSVLSHFFLYLSHFRAYSISLSLCFSDFSLLFFPPPPFKIHRCTSRYVPRWRVNTIPRRLKCRGISSASERMRFFVRYLILFFFPVILVSLSRFPTFFKRIVCCISLSVVFLVTNSLCHVIWKD